MARPELVYTPTAASARAEDSQQLVSDVAKLASDPFNEYHGMEHFGTFDRVTLAHENPHASLARSRYVDLLRTSLNEPIQMSFDQKDEETRLGFSSWFRSLPLGTVVDLKIGSTRAYGALVTTNEQESTRHYHHNLAMLIAADIRSKQNPAVRATSVTDINEAVYVHPDVSPAVYNASNPQVLQLWKTDNFNQALGGAFGDWLTAFGPVGAHRFSDNNHMPTGLEQVANLAVQGHTFGNSFLRDSSGQPLKQGALLHLGHELDSWQRFQQAIHTKSRPFTDVKTDLGTEDPRYTIQRPITALALPSDISVLGSLGWSLVVRPENLDQDGNFISNIGPSSAIWQYNTRTIGLGAAGIKKGDVVTGLMNATQVDPTRQLF